MGFCFVLDVLGVHTLRKGLDSVTIKLFRNLGISSVVVHFCTCTDVIHLKHVTLGIIY